MKYITYDENPEKLSSAAGACLLALSCRLIAKYRRLVIGTAAGRAINALLSGVKDMPWSQITLMLADERLVPLWAAESNYGAIKRLFNAGEGPLKGPHLLPFPTTGVALDAALAGYQASLTALGGRFHLVILSMGEDGHVASLFPGHAALDAMVPQGFIAIDAAPKPPPQRMSASLQLLQKADAALLFACGPEKSAAVQRFCDPRLTVYDCPAKLVEQIPEVHIFTDVKIPEILE